MGWCKSALTCLRVSPVGISPVRFRGFAFSLFGRPRLCLPRTGFFEKAVLGVKANTMKTQKAFSLALLLIEVAFTLFIAGIVVPSLLRSDLATKEALAAGSLRTINIAGLQFSNATRNV